MVKIKELIFKKNCFSFFKFGKFNYNFNQIYKLNCFFIEDNCIDYIDMRKWLFKITV